MRARLGAHRHPVQRGDRRPHRHADDLGVAQARVGHRRQHALRAPGPHPIGQPRAGVGLVDHDRHAAPASRAAAGGEVGGQRHIAAEADDHIGLDAVQDRPGLSHRSPHAQRQPHQIAVGLARQRHRRDQLKLIAAFGHQPGLQAAGGAQCGDAHRGVELGERIGDRHRGLDVACGAAAGEHHGDRRGPKPSGRLSGRRLIASHR